MLAKTEMQFARTTDVNSEVRESLRGTAMGSGHGVGGFAAYGNNCAEADAGNLRYLLAHPDDGDGDQATRRLANGQPTCGLSPRPSF